MPAVDSRAADALVARAEEAVARARRFGRPVLASVTVRLADDIDVAACTFASRRADERWFVWEQPDRDGFAIGALGAAVLVDAAPTRDRFAQAARACSDAMRDAVRDERPRPPGIGPAVGRRLQLLPGRLHQPRVVVLSAHGSRDARAVADAIGRHGARDAQRDVPRRRRSAGRSRHARQAGSPGSACRPLPLVDPDPAGRIRDLERPLADGLRARRRGGSAARARRRRREARAGA